MRAIATTALLSTAALLIACDGMDAEDVEVNPDGPERIAELERAVADEPNDGRPIQVIGDEPDYTRPGADGDGLDRYEVPTDTPPNEIAKFDQVGALVCPESEWLGVDDYDAGREAITTEYDAWLLEEDVPEGIVETASGLRYQVIHPGIERGYVPQKFDDVTVHYHGTLGSGEVFDSSYERGDTISFKPAEVISGWTEALMTMAPCEARTLYIPAELAYGSRGTRGIAPDTPLVFNVQVLEVEVPS